MIYRMTVPTNNERIVRVVKFINDYLYDNSCNDPNIYVFNARNWHLIDIYNKIVRDECLLAGLTCTEILNNESFCVRYPKALDNWTYSENDPMYGKLFMHKTEGVKVFQKYNGMDKTATIGWGSNDYSDVF